MRQREGMNTRAERKQSGGLLRDGKTEGISQGDTGEYTEPVAVGIGGRHNE